MPISVEPGDVEPGTKELRLAVVCYGGVSLAIYMHGVTKELQSLYLASEGYALSQQAGRPRREDNPFPADRTEHAYWEAIREAHEADGSAATRVVIDILSGTSAGGINGIVLAKALAEGESQDRLRDVWFEKGSIVTLANPLAAAPEGLLARAKAVWGMRKGPLNGNLLLEQVFEALEAMDAEPPQRPAVRANGRSPWPIELHVTLTDITGFPQAAPAWDPKSVKDRRHRYVLSFRTDRNQFARTDNRALAFAARATSSFPGAFPPTRIADVEDLGEPWDGLGKFLKDYWEIYEVSQAKAYDTAFVDGGVLNNAPFDLAIKGIEERPATSQVDRRLLYIQPDPVEPGAQDGQVPGWGKIVWRGVAGIPRREPILNDLLRLRAYNDKVQRVREVVAAAEAHADLLPDPPQLEGLDEAERQVRAAMDAQSMAQATYRQLTLHSVVDRLADVALDLLNLPPESDQAFFVRDVMVEWARRRGLLTVDAERWDAEQLPFLRAFDLGYRERRIRFAIARLNSLYETGTPSRDALDRLKQALYTCAWKVSSLAAEARAQAAAGPLQEVFGRALVREQLESAVPDPGRVVSRYVDAKGAKLDEVRAGLQALLAGQLENFTRDAYRLLLDHTRPAEWDAVRTRMLRAFVAFPLYDALLFPIRALSELGELDPVEVVRLSPLDSTLVPVPGVEGRPATVAEKLEGEGIMHFGAFFGRSRRENDYLWGRLDAVERLIGLVVGDETPSRAYKLGFGAVIAAERDALASLGELTGKLATEIGGLDESLVRRQPLP